MTPAEATPAGLADPVGRAGPPAPVGPQDAARTWVLAGRDGELAAWHALYDALHPRPDALAGAPGRAA